MLPTARYLVDYRSTFIDDDVIPRTYVYLPVDYPFRCCTFYTAHLYTLPVIYIYTFPARCYYI